MKIAVGAYLGRFKGSSREHTGSDLRAFLTWCGEHGVQPLAAHRADLELYVRWMHGTAVQPGRSACSEEPSRRVVRGTTMGLRTLG